MILFELDAPYHYTVLLQHERAEAEVADEGKSRPKTPRRAAVQRRVAIMKKQDDADIGNRIVVSISLAKASTV